MKKLIFPTLDPHYILVTDTAKKFQNLKVKNRKMVLSYTVFRIGVSRCIKVVKGAERLTVQIVGERKKTLIYDGDGKADEEKFEYL